MRKDTIKYADFTAPGVEVHCLYGEGSPTVERYAYSTIHIGSLDVDAIPLILDWITKMVSPVLRLWWAATVMAQWMHDHSKHANNGAAALTNTIRKFIRLKYPEPITWAF